MPGGFDYGTPERNRAEIDRVKAEGALAARLGKSSFGAGDYKPGDMTRAHWWLVGYEEERAKQKEPWLMGGRYCDKCGGPEPCSKRACIDALSADADYQEGKVPE